MSATIEDVVDVVDQLDNEPVALDVEATLNDMADVSQARAHELVRDALDVGVIEEYETDQGYAALRANSQKTTGEDAETSDTTPTLEAGEPGSRGGVTFREVYLRAAERVDREPWEYVEEHAIRTAFENSGFGHLLDTPGLGGIGEWAYADLSDDDEDEERPAWYCPSGNEPRPDEFRRFHSFLMEKAPDGYEPYYFKVRRASKAPATQFGSWKQPDAQLTVDEAVDWMEQGGNVGLSACGPCEGCGGRQSEYCEVCEGEELEDALINIDIDDDEETTPADIPATLLADSRSRTGWHGWGFNHSGDIPNIPTEDYGETRTSWQYVVAPGSFVASKGEAIPDDATDPGYYTIRNAEPVAEIEYDDLPHVFHEAHRAQQIQETEQEARSQDVDIEGSGATGIGTGTGTVDTQNPLFDFDATELCSNADPSDRFTSIFHGSSTSSNMSVSDGHDLVTCWRHNCSHGGLQALCVLSDVAHVSGFGCSDLGAAHKNSGGGPNRLKGDWRLVWGAWHEAKRRGIIERDNTIPYRVLRELAVADDVVDREELVERDSQTGTVVTPAEQEDHDGDTYTALPSGSYNEALLHIEGTYDVDTGREPVATSEFEAMLPAGVRDLTTTQPDSVLSLDETRRRTVDEIKDAFRTSDRCYIEALPGSGKSYGAIKAASECGDPVTVLANRGHKEQYEQFREWAAERDLSVKQLPSFARDCPTANGTHGDAWRDRVRQWYANGATPKTIHKYANAVIESEHGLPCCESGTCEYSQKWDFEPEDYDVLLGHYTHAYRPKVTTNRAVVIDEFVNGSFETELKGDDLQGAVNHWLSTLQYQDDIRFDSYTDLIENRNPAQCHCETSDCDHINEKREDALQWFDDRDVERSEILDDTPDAHAAAPLAVYTLLKASPVGADSNATKSDLSSTDLRKNSTESSESSVERTTWHDGDRIGIFDPEMTAGDSTKTVGGVSILSPPAFTNASSLVALDGTPTGELWELALNEDLNRRQVLADNERRDYIQNALGIDIIQTTEHVKPYNCSDHVAIKKDAALLDAIESKHGEAAGVITTSTAKQAYRGADIDVSMADCRHYGNVKGSNAFKSKRVGAVIGSNHYGDAFIRKWAAFAGEVAQRNDAKGAGLSYGEFGDAVLKHMREHDTLQALFRFGRDGEGATVYVHTNTLPEWVPLAGSGRVVKTWSDGMRSVISAVEDLQSATVSDIAGHQAVDIGARQIFDHVETLREKGVLSRARDDADGRRFVWFDSNLSRIDDHGEVELPTTDVDDLESDEVDELTRNTIYTCECIHSGDDDTMTGSESGSTPQQSPAASIEAVDSGEPPG